MADVTVIILTFNEERHLERAIATTRGFASRVVVVDSFSTDRTVEIARQLGAEVLQNEFVSQSNQFQWALNNAPVSTGWLMRLDADEVIEPDLAAEIEAGLSQLPGDVVGVNLQRKHIWMDHWVRFGGRYPLTMLRIWRTGQGRVEDRWMDEHIVVWGGRTVTFRGGFADHNLNDISFFTEKHNKYATREAIDVLNRRLRLFPVDDSMSRQGSSLQASAKRWIKERIYNRLPFTISAPAYFLWRYLFQLGFLDGRTGLVYHFLQGYWYRFLVGAKLLELERAVGHLSDKQEILEELSRLTGLRLVAE